VYMLAVVVSFIFVFLYCVCALFMCNLCYLSVVLLYYCHRVKAQLQFNKYIYIYIYICIYMLFSSYDWKWGLSVSIEPRLIDLPEDRGS
jgi:hypothetical protein